MTRAEALLLYLQDYRAQRAGRLSPPDCALFVAGWVRALGGPDLARAWRGRYATLEDGRALLGARGFHCLSDLARHYLPPVPACDAQPGDIAVIGRAGSDHFGILGGPHIHVLRAGGGLDILPARCARELFRP